MPRPKTKNELIDFSNVQFNKLNEFIDSLSEEMKTQSFHFEDRDRNVRDVLVHLYEWHKLLIDWIKTNLREEKKHILPEEYTWKTYPLMNVEFWKKHQDTRLIEATNLLMKSHKNVFVLIESLSNEELFVKKHFNWTGTTSLGAYCVSATSSHYDWVLKKIKKHKKLFNT